MAVIGYGSGTKKLTALYVGDLTNDIISISGGHSPIEHLIFEMEKKRNTCWWFKITLIWQKGRILLILFFKCVFKSMDNLPRNDKTITKLFLAAVNMIGFYPYFLRAWISLSHRKHWNILNIYFLLKFLIYRDIHNLDITNENKEVLKTRIKDCAFSSFCWFNDNGAPLNLSPEELAPLNHFQKTNNLIVQKSHEGNSITIIDKKFYLQKM